MLLHCLQDRGTSEFRTHITHTHTHILHIHTHHIPHTRKRKRTHRGRAHAHVQPTRSDHNSTAQRTRTQYTRVHGRLHVGLPTLPPPHTKHTYTHRGDNLSRLFRFEFVRNYKIPLNPDVYSGMCVVFCVVCCVVYFESRVCCICV